MKLSETLQLRPASFRRWADIAAVFALLALTVGSMWGLLGDEPIVGPDPATQYYPWYSFLGESLWSANIPAWDPHEFSGTPFAADPLSGWTYLPAMLLFTFLPLSAAANAYVVLPLLLAGLFAYALARSLGMGTPGGLLAAVAYEYNGFLYLQNICCLPYAAVVAWLPLAILGAEKAIRSRRWPGRAAWWGASGLGLSQILAAWLGQGSYYALLALGGYVAYRTLLFPPDNIRGLRGRLLGSVMHGGAVLAFGFGLAAAGLLPRLEYNALSNLAGGYPEAGATAEEVGGWAVKDWGLLLEPGFWYAGFTVLALALVAPLISQGRFSAPFFAVLALCALVLSGQGPTPLHSALYLLPYFERLHPHDPDRVLLVFYLCSALLAGAALTVLGEKAVRRPLLLVLPALATLLLVRERALASPIEAAPDRTAIASGWVGISSLLSESGVPISAGPLLALISAVLLVPAYALIPPRLATLRGLASVLLVAVVFADLLAANRAMIDEHPNAVGVKTDLTEYYRSSEAVRFLQDKGEEEPSRYFGFDPRALSGGTISSPVRFEEPAIQALEVNNRAILHGLHDIQGYNAVRIARYNEYVRALNGVDQNYHHADILDEDFDSPLLDLLNARYVIVPAEPPGEPAGSTTGGARQPPGRLRGRPTTGARKRGRAAARLDRPLHASSGNRRRSPGPASRRTGRPPRDRSIRRSPAGDLATRRSLLRPCRDHGVRSRPDRATDHHRGAGPARAQRGLLPRMEGLRGRRARPRLPHGLPLPLRANTRRRTHGRAALRVVDAVDGSGDLVRHPRGTGHANRYRRGSPVAGDRGRADEAGFLPAASYRRRRGMIDVGVITGSGIYELPGGREPRVVESRFGEAEVTVFRAGSWSVGSISRHGRGHHHLPHTVPYRANLASLEQLGARAVLATTTVGAVEPGIPLGRPILFDELFFPENRLPGGEPCTVFTEPGDPERGHSIMGEPFSPRLRRRMELAARGLGMEVVVGGVYGHTNGPRFETRAEIRALQAAGVTAVSQTCGPEAVLAGELEMPFCLVGFPVNYATGVAESEPKEELDRLLSLSARVLPGSSSGRWRCWRRKTLASGTGTSTGWRGVG